MKIEVTRSGGFAGVTSKFLADEKFIMPVEVEQLKDLLHKTNFSDLSTNVKEKTGADYYIYEITVEMDGRIRTVQTTDLTISKNLRFLVNKVIEIHGRSH